MLLGVRTDESQARANSIESRVLNHRGDGSAMVFLTLMCYRLLNIGQMRMYGHT